MHANKREENGRPGFTERLFPPAPIRVYSREFAAKSFRFPTCDEYQDIQHPGCQIPPTSGYKWVYLNRLITTACLPFANYREFMDVWHCS
jgi:hypothetical protein